MLTVNNMVGGGAGAAAAIPVSKSFIGTTVNTADQTAYTFSSHAIGTASATRQVIVSASGSDMAGVAAITVGGVSASEDATAVQGSVRVCSIWSATVTTGTAADIVVTFDDAGNRCGIGVWAIYDAGSVSDTATDSNADGSALAGTIDCPANGVIIGAAFGNENRTTTWAEITEDYDTGVEVDLEISGASDLFSTAQTNLAVTATPSGATNFSVLAVVSYGPA